ncbi:CLUMA_CG004997, isoform A [Clunio marinus]|uniref:CLUMA_CG004997, isoform A n=1 Tax=Clunio marinus TaxID=568069 RepID=A0A1J1HTK3_9DIPT|nr:CLUMA_CG004997, isoform A [Clunio marinus]
MINSNHNTQIMRQTPTNTNKKFCSMTYVPNISERISKLIRSKTEDVQLAFKPQNKVKNFFTRLKDKKNKLDLKNLIYKIPCECGCCYIGQTIQMLHKRLSQHKTDVNRLKKLLLDPKSAPGLLNEAISKSALVKHVSETNHKFDFDAVEILDVANQRSQLNVLEMLHIKANNTVNQRTDTLKLSQLYNGIIKIKNRKNKTPTQLQQT